MADDMYEYRTAVADLLAATLREVEASKALSVACDAEDGSEWRSALAQQCRQAVYAADGDREDAAERYYRMWRRVGGDPLSLGDHGQ